MCGNIGHYAKDCPQNQPRQMPAPNQEKGKKQKVQVKQGRLNFTTLKELPEGAPVMTGTFSVFNQPVLILFDSGASHSFISQKFSVKCHCPSTIPKGFYDSNAGRQNCNQSIKAKCAYTIGEQNRQNHPPHFGDGQCGYHFGN
jgi:hypothetical protein